MGENDPPEPPSRIGRYEIRRELGRGTMGVVYQADDPALGRTIALKTIELAFAVSRQDRKAFEGRFLAEARIAARLSHPGIIAVHDVGRDTENDLLYIALEYLPGRTLAEVIKDGPPMEWREALRVTARVAEALQHAHSKGVVHRDIKPANIMLLPSGEPKIMDFGIAKIETARLQLTSAGQFFGTPLYMSPEQALGHKVDPRSDLFSLGAVAYALLSGRQAFGAENIPTMIKRIVQENPPPPSVFVPGLPRDVDYLLGRALAKTPADRYPDGRTLADDCEDILAGRPPRHRGAWEPPSREEGTLGSSSCQEAATQPELNVLFTGESRALHPKPDRTAMDLEAELATLVGEPTPPPEAVGPRPSLTPQPLPCPRLESLPTAQRRTGLAPERRIRSHARVPLLVLGVLTTALVAALAILHVGRRGEPSPAGSSREPSASPAQPAPPTPAFEAGGTPSQSPASSLFAREAPRASPGASVATPPSAASSADKPARLLIDFAHPLKRGTLRLWLDGEPVLEEDLNSRVAAKIAGIELRKGGLEKLFEVTPGRHEVRVQVTWEDNSKSDTIWGTFRAGSMRQLEVRIGRLRKNLSVEWM